MNDDRLINSDSGSNGNGSSRNRFGFDFSNVPADLFGGITAGIVALPLALAFGLQSGLGAAAGLYGAIFIAFFAALFGGTRTQISGPTAPMTAVSMVVIAGIIAANEGNLERALPAILIIFLLAGLLQIGLGLLKFGQYIRFIPYPVVSGFMTGIGVIILITQVHPMLGYYPKEDTTYVSEYVPLAEEQILERILSEEAGEGVLALEDFEETINRAGEITGAEIQKEAGVLAANNASGVIGSIKLTGQALKNISLVDFFLGLATILIIYGFKRVTKAVPSTLVALLVVSLGAFLFLPEYRTIGTIPSGFPKLRLDIFGNISVMQLYPYLISAVSLAILGAIDSLLTSVVADNMTRTRHRPDQELMGQGIGNSVAALFGGIPGAGATIRTVVNIKSGGHSKLSGMTSSVLLLVVLLVLGPLASKIPAAVLAGILVTVGIGVMDYKGLRHIRQAPKAEVFVMLLVLGLTVFVGLIEAVLLGLVLSCVLFMKHYSDVVEKGTNEAAPLKEFSREMQWVDEGEIIDQFGDHVYIKHLDGPLFFGFASRFQEIITNLPEMKVFVIRMDRVPYIDQSGLYSLEDAIRDLHDRDVKVLFTDLHGQPLDILERLNIIPALIDRKYCFVDFESCSAWLQHYLKQNTKP